MHICTYLYFWDNDIEPFLLRSMTLKWLLNAGVTTQLKMLQRIEFTKVLTIFTEIYRQTQRFRFRCSFFFFKLLCRAMRLRDRQKKINVYTWVSQPKRILSSNKRFRVIQRYFFVNKLLVFVLFFVIVRI